LLDFCMVSSAMSDEFVETERVFPFRSIEVIAPKRPFACDKKSGAPIEPRVARLRTYRLFADSSALP
jgi:hypothetical protein